MALNHAHPADCLGTRKQSSFIFTAVSSRFVPIGLTKADGSDSERLTGQGLYHRHMEPYGGGESPRSLPSIDFLVECVHVIVILLYRSTKEFWRVSSYRSILFSSVAVVTSEI